MNSMELVTLLLLGLCWSAQSQVQTNRSLLPSRFSVAFYFGAMVANSRIEWNGKALVYTRQEYGQTLTNITVTPTDRQWREFWAAAEKVQLSKWQRTYECPNIPHGHVWKIGITKEAQKIDTLGRNAVPDETDVTKTWDGDRPSKTFGGFMSALEALLGFKLK